MKSDRENHRKKDAKMKKKNSNYRVIKVYFTMMIIITATFKSFEVSPIKEEKFSEPN